MNDFYIIFDFIIIYDVSYINTNFGKKLQLCKQLCNNLHIKQQYYQ
jgi:hypothetical protein